MRDPNSGQSPELPEVLVFLMEVARRDDLHAKKKKNIIDVFKTILSNDSIVPVFNATRRVLEELIITVFNLPEAEGLKMMKAFNLFLLSHSPKLKPEAQRVIFSHYYVQLGHVLDSFRETLGNVASNAARFAIAFSEQNNKVKAVRFKDSIVINEEILSHVIVIMDKDYPSHEYVQDMMQKILQLLVRLRLDAARAHLDEFYFIDLLHLTSKALSFFGNLLTKKRESLINDKDGLWQIVQMLEDNSEKSTDLVSVLLDFLNLIPGHFTKLKVDSFFNLKTFFDKYPERMVRNMRRMLTDDFFSNVAKVRFSDIEMNKIYYYWISAHKNLIKNHKRLLIENLDVNDAFMLIENNINILFEESIYPNYLLNLLHNVGNLCEVLREKIALTVAASSAAPSPGPNGPAFWWKTYSNFLMGLLKKLVAFLKQSRCSIKDLVAFLRAPPAEGALPRTRHLEDISRLDKEGILRALSKDSERVLEDELIMKDTFLTRFYGDVLVQHSFNVDVERNYKLESFLEDSIVKKVGILNDIIQKYLTEYFKAALMLDKERTAKGYVDSRAIYFITALNFNEERIIRKIYTNNLQIFGLLLCNAKLMEYERIYDSIKFTTVDFFVIKNCLQLPDIPAGQKNSADVLVRFRDIHQIFEHAAEKIMLTFCDIYNHAPENYTTFYTLFIDLFSGSGVIEAATRQDPDLLIAARLINKAFNEIIIVRTIQLLQKKKLEYFDVYSKNCDFKIYSLKILKGIYRKIKYRDGGQGNSVSEEVMDIKEATFKLVLMIMEKVYKEPDVMVFLHLMRNIFVTVYKITSFCTYFTEEAIHRGIKLLSFFHSLFSSHYQELKIIAVELFVFCPIETKRFLRAELRRPADAIRLLELITFALELPDNPLIVKTLHILEHLLSFYDRSDLRVVFNNKLGEIFNKWSNLLKNKENCFTIFKKNLMHDSQKLKLAVKIIGKYSELLNEARELTEFSQQNEQEGVKTVFLDFIDEKGHPFAHDFDIKRFIEILYSELSELKQRPWFNNFYSISISFMSLCTNKHKKGLEKLFVFLINFIEKLDEMRSAEKQAIQQLHINNTEMEIEQVNGENDKNESVSPGLLYEKTFECIYGTVFFIYPFKITETPLNYQEMDRFKLYINEIIRREPEMKTIFLKLFMRNLLLNLELSNEELDWTIFALTRDYISIFIDTVTQNREYQRLFVIELNAMLTRGCIYSINAAFYLFKELVLDRWGENTDLATCVFEKRIQILQSLFFANKFIDKKLNLKINLNFKTCLQRFLKLLVENPIEDRKLIELFADVRNFEEYHLFKIMVTFSKKEGISFPFFTNITDVICKQINSYLKTIKSNEEDRASLWTFDFLQHIKLLVAKLLYAFDEGLYQEAVSQLKEDVIIVIQFINVIKDEILNFDRRERDFRGSTVILKPREPTAVEETHQQFVDNPDVYYTNYALKLHVDKYDFIIKEFTLIFEKCVELVSKIFTKNIFEEPPAEQRSPAPTVPPVTPPTDNPAEPGKVNGNAEVKDFAALRGEYLPLKESCFNKILDLSLRTEKRMLKAILKFLPSLYLHDPRANRNEQFTNFKILLKLFQKNEIGENNLYIISKLVKNYPKLINFDG